MASCPVCKVALTGKIYDGVTFSECPQCAGVWFFEDDLRHVESEKVQDLDQVDLMDVPIQPAASQSDALACPMCGKEMGQFHFMVQSPILLHRCEVCEGLWIEHGKLTEMAAAIEGANKPPTQQEIDIETKAEADYTHEVEHGIMPPPVDAVAPHTVSPAEIQFDQEHEATLKHYSAIGKFLGWRFRGTSMYFRL